MYVLHISNIVNKKHYGGPKFRFFAVIDVFDRIDMLIVELAGQK
jgi:hypothetical protein